MAKMNATGRNSGAKMELTVEMQQKAVHAIDEFAKAEKTVKQATDSASKHVLSLMQYALEKAGKEKAIETFQTMCRHAEKVYSENHSEDIKKPEPISTLLPFWRVAKSQVVAAFKAGVDIGKVKSVYEAVKQTKPAKKSRAPGGQTNAGNGEGSGDGGQVTLPGVLTQPTERMWKALKAIVLTSNKDAMARAADAVVELAETLESILSDAAPATDEGTGDSRQTATA